jgi:P-type E1-E2 ATPase
MNMKVTIPGRPGLDIQHVVFDYNGTLAVDGALIPGVAAQINHFAPQLIFHVITADTYGTVAQALEGVACTVHVIPNGQQDTSKLQYVEQLGKENVLAVGNGNNDKLMLQAAALGIALIQAEGASVQAVMAADVVCKSVLDVFGYFATPNRLVATLRN